MEGEHFLCFGCLVALPRTGYAHRRENPLEKLFAGRIPYEGVASFAYFSKEGMLQKIVHELKYGDNPELGQFLGGLAYRELGSSPFFRSVDCIVPVPLHPKRLKKRGYNQSYHLGKGLSDASGIPLVADNLVRIVNNPSQTALSRTDRWSNVDGIFAVTSPETFRGRHVLLVDDILTTGSTLESCAKTLLASSDLKISIFSIGSTL